MRLWLVRYDNWNINAIALRNVCLNISKVQVCVRESAEYCCLTKDSHFVALKERKLIVIIEVPCEVSQHSKCLTN